MAMQTIDTAEMTPTPSVPGYLSIAEAARILGKTPGALYMILYRNKQRYRTVRAGNAILIPNDVMMRLFNEQQAMEE